MTKKEVVSLSLKLAGIYCLIMSLSNLSFTSMTLVSTLRREGFWQIITSMTSFMELLLPIIPCVLLILFGIYLLFSSKLPLRIATPIIQEEKATSCTFQDIQVLAFSIIGVWLLSTAIPNLSQVIVRMPELLSYGNTYLISQIIATVLKLALGIYLFLGGKGLVRLWQKFNNQEA